MQWISIFSFKQPDTKNTINSMKNKIERIGCVEERAVYLFLAAAARSRCLRFLNQLPTCVGVKPVACANSRFFVGFGYGSCRYHSRKRLRVRSLKQCVFCSPSQMVRGSGNFLRTRYLSTGPGTTEFDQSTISMADVWTMCFSLPKGRPRNFSASW